jgi:regulator of replication initiation timing
MKQTVKKKTIFKSLNRKLVGLVLITAIVSFGAQIYITAKVGTKTAEIEYIRNEKDRLRLENEILKSKIDKSLSVTNIEESISKYNLEEKQIIELEGKDVSALSN